MWREQLAPAGRTRPDGGPRTRPAPGRRAGDPHPGHRRGLLFSAGLGALLIAAAVYLLDPRTLPIRHVRVDGEFRHLSTAVLELRAEDVVRGGFFNVNVEAIRTALRKEPWVREVSVRRTWPDELELQVQEQVAVARWGAEGLLNDQGQWFQPAPESLPPGLPALSGPIGSQAQVLARFRALERALAPHALNVAQLKLSERRSWSFELAGGPSVELGRSDFEARVGRFAAAVPAYLAAELGRIESIDMRYTNGFAVRWKSSGAGITSGVPENHGQAEN